MNRRKFLRANGSICAVDRLAINSAPDDGRLLASETAGSKLRDQNFGESSNRQTSLGVSTQIHPNSKENLP